MAEIGGLANRIAQLLTDSKQWAGGEWEQGLQECEEMLLYRPHDPELNLAAAAAALGLRRMVEARDYVDCAIEHSPDVSRYHAVLAKVLAGTGDRGHAIKELQLAAELDPSNREAVELLEKLSPRRVAHGGSE